MIQNTQNNPLDYEGLWVITVDPPKDSGYYKGQIVEISAFLERGYDWWDPRFDSVQPCNVTMSEVELIVHLRPHLAKDWTVLSNLEKVYIK